jgi:hypothetical protein
MKAHGEGGVLVSLLGFMWWVYGRILGGVGGSFVVVLDLRWEMVARLDSCLAFGVGIWPSRMPFLVLFDIACVKDVSVAAHM